MSLAQKGDLRILSQKKFADLKLSSQELSTFCADESLDSELCGKRDRLRTHVRTSLENSASNMGHTDYYGYYFSCLTLSSGLCRRRITRTSARTVTLGKSRQNKPWVQIESAASIFSKRLHNKNGAESSLLY